MNHDPRFDDVVFMIEADSFARYHLWMSFSGESETPIVKDTIRWEQDTDGLIVEIGRLQTVPFTSPVVCEISFAKLEGLRVVFFNACSRIVDWGMIHDWMKKRCPGAEKCNADNFHMCLAKIRKLAVCSEVHES